MSSQNLFNEIPPRAQREFVEVLAASSHMRIERIVSHGHNSPNDFWYDQNEHEFVVVLQGRAAVLFEKTGKCVELGAGDWINIGAHEQHRVAWTSDAEETVWLAVFYS